MSNTIVPFEDGVPIDDVGTWIKITEAKVDELQAQRDEAIRLSELFMKERDCWKETAESIRGDRDKWRREGQEIIAKAVKALEYLRNPDNCCENYCGAEDILQEIALLK